MRPILRAPATPWFRSIRTYLMSIRFRQTAGVLSVEASSTTIISTSRPAARALSTARGSRWGRLWVAMITLTLGIAKIRSMDALQKSFGAVAQEKLLALAVNHKFSLVLQKFLDGPVQVLF